MAELSLFTSDVEEDVSPTKRQDIATCRALLALSVVLIFLFWGAYRLSGPNFVDPLWGRALFALVPATALLVSYLSASARLRVVYLWRGFLCATVAWFTGLSAVNGFAPAYTLGLLFVVAATNAGYGVGLRRQRPLLPFLAFATLLPGGTALWAALVGSFRSGSEGAVLSIFLAGLVSLAVIFYLVLDWRVRVEETLQKRRREARAASRLKTSIIGNISHEIRTPLTSILGFAETLEEELTGPPGEMATSIRRSGDRLRRVLEALLELSSLEAGNAGFEPEWIRVGEQIKSVAEEFSPWAQEKGIGLEIRLENRSEERFPTELCDGRRPEEAEKAFFNPDLLQRIVGVLVDNALKFTEEGQVIVTAGLEEEQLRLAVRDSGVGMDDAEAETLFEPFRQGSEGLDREHEGLGLGLSLVGELVELLGGKISVESEKGEGTRVEVLLPRFQAANYQSEGF